MAISMEQVKELREKSGAGMTDCKKALEATDGTIDAAIDWLRTKGLASAAKKAGRVAAEGLIGVVSTGKQGCMVELNAETDFVGRSEQFQQLVSSVAQSALATDSTDVEDIKNAPLKQSTVESSQTVQDAITAAVATIGENMALRRVSKLSVGNGFVASYVHNAVVPNLGKIGVLVALESEAPQEVLQKLGKQLAMHIAANRPEALSQAEIDPANIERERAVLTEQAQASGKPADMIAKMVEGRLRKYYEEVVLLEQTFVVDGERKIAKVVEDMAKECGCPIQLAAFSRYQLGEGIERETSDFAAEVAAQIAAAAG